MKTRTGSDIERMYPLSAMQSAMILQYLMDDKRAVYYDQSSFYINGYVDYNRFCLAWRKVIALNETLRSSFIWEGIEAPVRAIHKETPLRCTFDSLMNKPRCDMETELAGILEHEWDNKPPLSANPFKIRLIQLSVDVFVMVITTHHIILDGWSFGVIIEEFMRCYFDEVTEQEIRSPKINYQRYLDYCESGDKDKTISFWKTYLKGAENINAPARMVHHAETVTETDAVTLDENIKSRAALYCKQNQITFAALIYGLWCLALYARKGRRNDILFNVTLSGRHIGLAGIENMTGLFIDTVPLRISMEDDLPVINMFRNISQDISMFLSLGPVSFTGVSHRVVPPAHRIYNSAVVIQNYPVKTSYGNGGENLDIAFRSGRFNQEAGTVLSVKDFGGLTQIMISRVSETAHGSAGLNCKFLFDLLQTVLDLDMRLNPTVEDILRVPL